MPLTSADVHCLEVPLNDDYATSHHDAMAAMTIPLVILRDGEGTVGLGTAEVTEGYSHQTPTAVFDGLLETLLPRVFESQPAHPNGLREQLRSVEGQRNASGALQMAFLDLYGRRTDRSVAELLGGPLTDVEPLNGWVGIDEPDAMVAELDAQRAAGFTAAKVKLSGDQALDAERVEAICEAAGDDMAIRFDANCGYAAVEDAIATAERMEAYDVVHFEQPLPEDDLAGLKRLAEATSVPIMADECIKRLQDVLRLLATDGADRMKFKALRLGGVLEAKTAFDMTAVAGMDCVIGHGFGLATSTSAEIQLASAVPNVVRPVECVGPYKFDDQPFSGQLAIEDAVATVPTGPGLGVELDVDALPSFSVREATVEP